MNNINPRLTADEIAQQDQDTRITTSLRRHIESEWERIDREERKRLWQGIGSALLITGLGALAVYVCLHYWR